MQLNQLPLQELHTEFPSPHLPLRRRELRHLQVPVLLVRVQVLGVHNMHRRRSFKLA